MESKIKVKFKTKGLDTVIIEEIESLKFSELVKKYFEKRNINYEENKDKIAFQINSTKEKLEWNSDKTLKDLNLKSDDFILVIDLRLNSRKNIRKKESITDEQAERNEKETFPEILADIIQFTEKCLEDVKDDEEKDYIKYEEVLKNQKDKYDLILGLIGKYLEEELNCDVYINMKKNKFDVKETINEVKTIRYLSTGLITKSKTIVSINLKEELNNKQKKELNDDFKETLKDDYSQLEKKEFVVTNYGEDENFKFHIIPVIPFKDGELEIEESTINNWINYLSVFQKDSSSINDSYLINHIVLNKSFLFPSQDRSKDEFENGKREKRGKFDYIPPKGWSRIGILASKYYGDDDSWLDYEGNKAWEVAYTGLRKVDIEEKMKEFENDDDLLHPREKVGLGVAVCQDPEVMEKDCQEIVNGIDTFLIGFVLRIKPDAIRIPKSQDGKYWVVKGTKDDLRPYGILYKKK